MNREEIIKKVQKLLGEDITLPINLAPICKKLGLSIYTFKVNNSNKDVSGVLDRDDKSILINPNHSRNRKQFTVAHEIGHYILHTDRKECIDYRTNSEFYTTPEDRKRECEANIFAAELLMPYSVFNKKWDEFNYSDNKKIKLLSELFLCSEKAVEIRAIELGLLTDVVEL